MISPDLRNVSRLARRGNVIPVCRRITADLLTPVSAYLGLARKSSHSFLLESVEGGEKIARYSFMGADPYRVVRYRLPRSGEGNSGEPRAEILEGGKRTVRSGSIFTLLRFTSRNAPRPAVEMSERTKVSVTASTSRRTALATMWVPPAIRIWMKTTR